VYVHDYDDMVDSVKRYYIRNMRDDLELVERGILSDVEILRISLEELFINHRLGEDDK